MPNETKNLAERWLDRIKSVPVVAMAVVAVIIVSGIAALLTNLKAVFDFAGNSLKHPYVAAFSLSPNALGFVETHSHGLFDHSYRAFEPSDETSVAVFLVTVSNPTAHDIIITRAIYDVEQVSQVLGGNPGPLVALARYHHTIEYAVGSQERQLIPPFSVPSGQAASFEIQLNSAAPGLGLGWYMRIGLATDHETFYTERFQVSLPARP